ncbi:caspase domain-containing protein [Lysobacter sp. GCM10012299]|uniref:caspase family protein n=1 Tax=Lysobacter sp. GCM10012299 TaxID=3317333 RepID=UPI003619F838
MRLLLAIGCDTYDHVSSLNGAEVDANRIFERLTSPLVGAYDPSLSRLLRSPTSDDIRSALRELLLIGASIDELTIYFAGHGSVGPASFYMATRDTRLDALSMTALSLGDVLRAVAESKALHTNIIIDACQSGGLIEDLNVILKSTLIGGSGSPGITLLAASASNEYAAETTSGGLATNALLECISGTQLVRDDVPTLELVEIGRVVAARLVDSGQAPVVWGLNLHGPSRFCSNQLYSKQDVDLRNALTKNAGSSHVVASKDSAELWKLYYSVLDDWDARRYALSLRKALKGIESSSVGQISDLAYRFCTSVLSRSSASTDALLQLEIRGATLSSLLPWMHQPEVRVTASLIATDLVSASREVCAKLLADLAVDRYVLLYGRGGLPDLYYLPIRVSQIVGWLALSIFDKSSFDPKESPDSSRYLMLCRQVLDLYPGAFTAMSESQAPFLVVAVRATEEAGSRETSEEMLGYFVKSAIECNALFGDAELSGGDAFTYLYARASDELATVRDLVSNPSELLTVILRLGQVLGLDDVLDQELWSLDGRSCVAFVSDALSEYGDEKIESGQNQVWQVGRNIFRVADFGGAWLPPKSVDPDALVSLSMACACLVLKDRVPWQLVDEILVRDGVAELPS